MEFNKEDAPAIGRAIYREKIRPTLGPEHKGKIVVIDVKSGDYAIADRHLDADIERCGSGVRTPSPGRSGWTCRIRTGCIPASLPNHCIYD